MFVVGTGLSYISGDFVVTTVGCFLLGLVLNRSQKPAQKAALSTSPIPQPKRQGFPRMGAPSAGVRCVTCGATAKRYTKYCTSCGSEMGPPPLPFAVKTLPRYRAEDIITRLERVGDEVQYAILTQDLLMVDESGRYWAIGARSSKWYVHEKGGWMAAAPTEMMHIIRGVEGIFQEQSGVTAPGIVATKPTVLGQGGKLPAKGQQICGFCGVELEQSGRFCINCGHEVGARTQPVVPVPARTRACKRCGATVNARKRFCTKCGSPLPAT
jgi:RNA polymerase subunit RPABC4/transcription elongation factor Spt4